MINANILLREKARMPRALHGYEWQLGVWGHASPSQFGFFFGRTPPFGRGSSLPVISVSGNPPCPLFAKGVEEGVSFFIGIADNGKSITGSSEKQ
jgi:hypothetical protein